MNCRFRIVLNFLQILNQLSVSGEVAPERLPSAFTLRFLRLDRTYELVTSPDEFTSDVVNGPLSKIIFPTEARDGAQFKIV